VAEPTESKSLLKRIVDVRGNELAPALVSQLWIFLAMTAYYIIKPIRSVVVQDVIKVANKPYALIATTLFVALFAYGYGRIAASVERKKLIIGTYIAFIGCICGFAAVMNNPSVVTGYVFFVWVSTFSVMIVSQFWALAADVWTKEEGVRLFSFIGYGTVAGGFSGTYVTKLLPKLQNWQFLLVSAGILGVCFLCALYILAFGAKKPDAPPERADKPYREAAGRPEQKDEENKPAVNALSMVLTSPYLRLIAVMTLLLNIVNTNNEWLFDKMIELAQLEDKRSYYADFYLWQNILAAVIQFGITGFVQRKFGARVALCFLPIIGMIGGGVFMIVPTLFVIRALKTAENATDYSIQSNTREFLYLPTTKLEKYAAKNVNETFVVRAGDLLAAGFILLVTFLVSRLGEGIGLKILVGANLAFAAIWVVVVLRIGSLNKELMEERHIEAKPEAK
jgi:ATP:ADP antiporter, AAA family